MGPYSSFYLKYDLTHMNESLSPLAAKMVPEKMTRLSIWHDLCRGAGRVPDSDLSARHDIHMIYVYDHIHILSSITALTRTTPLTNGTLRRDCT